MSRLTNHSHPLLTDVILEKLRKFKIQNEIDFINTKAKVIQSLTKISFKQVCAIKDHFTAKCPTYNGFELIQELREKALTISSGLKSVDQLLEGGFQNYKIYELCGLPGSGKTLFCYSVIRSYLTQFCNMVYYIDTKGDFNAMKFREMLEVEHLDDEIVVEHMKRVLVKQCYTKYDLLNTLYAIKEDIDNNVNTTHLIVIDSLPSIFYCVINYKRDADLLKSIVNIMGILCKKKYVSFIVTNFYSRIMQSNAWTERIEGGTDWERNSDVLMKIECQEESFKITITRNENVFAKNLNNSCVFYII